MNAVYNQKKVVRVTYENEDIFKIPSNIDLENKDQVEEWWVKWNTLYIRLKGKSDEELIEIESEGWERDEKHPTSETIEDAEDFGVEDEDFVRVDMKTGKKCDHDINLCLYCQADNECVWFQADNCWICKDCDFEKRPHTQNIPEEIVSHILSFRPRHPLAQIILDFKERAVAEAETELYEGDQSIFDESLHKTISYTQEGELFWKNTLGDGDPDLYCWRVRRDYDAVYNGDWNYGCDGCAPWLGLYEDPTQPTRDFKYSPEAYANPLQRKIEWAIFLRRKNGDAPK